MTESNTEASDTQKKKGRRIVFDLEVHEESLEPDVGVDEGEWDLDESCFSIDYRVDGFNPVEYEDCHALSLALSYISGGISRRLLIEQCECLMLDEDLLYRWTITEYENAIEALLGFQRILDRAKKDE